MVLSACQSQFGKDEMEQEVDSKAECYLISFLFSLFVSGLCYFYLYTELSTLFLFHSPNGKLKKDKVILMMLQLYKATTVLTGKVHLLMDT